MRPTPYDLQRALLIYLGTNGGATLATIATFFGKTPATIRRHIRALAGTDLALRGTPDGGYWSPLGPLQATFWQRPPTGRRPLQVVEVRLSGAAYHQYQADQLHCLPEWFCETPWSEARGDVTFLTRDLAPLARWLAAAPAGVEVLGPPELRRLMLG